MKPKKKTKKKMGRPKVKIDWEEFKKLCLIQCTLSEISDWFKCSESTIVRKCKQEKGCTFEGYFKKNSAKGRISLRRSQFKLSQNGNPAMNIWLGKQYLGQTDKPIESDNAAEAKPIKIIYEFEDASKPKDDNGSKG